MTSNYDQPHRAHPLAILMRSLSMVYIVLWRGVSSLSKDGYAGNLWVDLVLGVGLWVLLTLLFIVPPYLATTYTLGPDAITVRSGVVRRHVLTVQYTRIQTIQRKQLFLFKPFGLETLRIETAAHTGDRPEISLAAVPLALRHEIERRQALSGVATPTMSTVTAQRIERVTPVVPAPATKQTYKMPRDTLLFFAITSLGFIPTTVILWTIYWRFQELPVLKSLTASVDNLVGVLLAGFIVGCLLVGTLISFMLTVSKYWGFTLTFDGHRLKARKGLITDNTVSATTARVQAVRYKQNIIRHVLHAGTAQVVLASGVGDDEDDNDMVILPLVGETTVWAQVHKYLDWVPAAPQPLQTFTTGRLALVRNITLPMLVLVAGLAYFVRPWGWLSAVLVPLAVAFGVFAGNARGLSMEGTVLRIAKGSMLVREEFILTRGRIQSLEVKQSWWMERTHLMHVEVLVRKGNDSQAIELRYIPATTGAALAAWFGRRVVR